MRPVPLIDKAIELKKVVNVLRAINHPLRKKMLHLLHEKQPINVTDIYVNLRIEQSVASQHLKILKQAKLVKAERKGTMILYKPNYDILLKLEKVIYEIVTEIVPD